MVKVIKERQGFSLILVTVISTSFITIRSVNSMVKKNLLSLFSGDKNAVNCYDLPGDGAFSYSNSSLQVIYYL